jgi:hypothetical protein
MYQYMGGKIDPNMLAQYFPEFYKQSGTSGSNRTGSFRDPFGGGTSDMEH